MSAFSITRPILLDEVAALVIKIQTEGYCVVKDYVQPDKLTALNSDMEDCFGRFSANFNKEGYVAPVGIQSVISLDRVINNVFHFHRSILEMATAGSHLDILKHFLNDPFYKLIPKEDPNFILAQVNARAGKVALPFHVDTRMCTVGQTTMSMQGYLSLGSTHAGNGGLRVIPGSHTSGIFPNSSVDYPHAISLNLNPGDLVLFSSELHHATTACLPDETPVWTVLFTYRCWWVKQQSDIESMVPQAWFQELTPNQKLIVGACSRVSTSIYDSLSLRKGYECL
jgi:ectoine hydroxylase-related dioxygenase (phytanoyl-CoA dioxygenase family)